MFNPLKFLDRNIDKYEEYVGLKQFHPLLRALYWFLMGATVLVTHRLLHGVWLWQEF